MNPLEALALAWAGLVSNRLRSGLTMLGILIGVAAVILLVAFGNGTAVAVQAQVQGLGSNVIYIFPQTQRVGGVAQGFGSGSSLSQADADALVDPTNAPHIVNAIPIAQASGNMTYANQNWNAQTTGSTEAFATVRSYDVTDGQMFSADDVRNSAKVVVIGQTVVDNLFQGQEPVGQSIKINRQTFRVVGTFAPKGAAGLGNQDNVAVVPITSAWAYLVGGRGKNVAQIIVQASDSQAVTQAQTEATSILLDRHKVADPTQADFTTQSQQDILNTFSAITNTLTALLGSIAAISLVVGGIGVMNIMLVTVTERTREIGIRKAIGARRRDILVQFLIESMFLSGVGGLLGIVVGIGLSVAVANAHVTLFNNVVPVVSVPSVLLAFGVSVAIGLFFGIYPANQAARLNPIEALRYE